MELRDILDQRLIEIIDRYLGEGQIGTNLKKALDKTKGADIIVPVLGMQGMGKSTLINGILKENILPNEAKETTCVPVEIKYGTEEHADVYFKNSDKKEIAHTKDDLQKYVDNEYNPGNEKNVDRIVLYRACELLKKGLVLVDLPGVGSLTKANEETTNHYIQNLCTAIFVIPTVPTIRKVDAVFIKTVWSQFPMATFVQNEWGETKQEISESVEYNQKCLKQISEELRTPYDGSIIVVNAYKAISGALKKDATILKESNIDVLVKRIQELSTNWQKNLDDLMKDRVEEVCEQTKNEIEKRKEEQKKSADEVKAGRRKEYEAYNEQATKSIEELEVCKRSFRDRIDTVTSTLKKKATDATFDLRARMYKTIEGGVFDGEMLDDAFERTQEDCSTDFSNEVVCQLNDMKFEFMSKLEEIGEIEKVKNDKKIGEFEKVNVKEKTKWERHIDSAASGLGGLAGGALACAIAGAAAGSGVPVVGTIIGGVIGGLLGMFGGKYVKKKVQSNRASETKKAIDPYIDDYGNRLKKYVNEKSEFMQKQIKTVIGKKIEEIEAESNRMKAAIDEKVEIKDEALINEEYSYVSQKMEELKNV